MFWKIFSIVTLYDPFSWLGYPVEEVGPSLDKDRDRERDSRRRRGEFRLGVSSGEVGSAEVSSGEMSSAEVSSGDVNSAEVSSGEVSSAEGCLPAR